MGSIIKRTRSPPRRDFCSSVLLHMLHVETSGGWPCTPARAALSLPRTIRPTHPSTHTIHPSTHLLTHSLTPPPTHHSSLTIHSLLTHSLTHSPTHPLTHLSPIYSLHALPLLHRYLHRLPSTGFWLGPFWLGLSCLARPTGTVYAAGGQVKSRVSPQLQRHSPALGSISQRGRSPYSRNVSPSQLPGRADGELSLLLMHILAPFPPPPPLTSRRAG
ncbi:hypothetical protein AOQ84DRAFT_127350 [Glonium stellatum]|uniref:Uncharacterized protein n=1 Tax=Glonium stellatum TaxID=574774 RepID=A0A8E2ETJ0_9PEZI|nr:hypothetical protein AOQ84DRAFT_127350 [Glonium stellatum]